MDSEHALTGTVRSLINDAALETFACMQHDGAQPDSPAWIANGSLSVASAICTYGHGEFLYPYDGEAPGDFEKVRDYVEKALNTLEEK